MSEPVVNNAAGLNNMGREARQFYADMLKLSEEAMAEAVSLGSCVKTLDSDVKLLSQVACHQRVEIYRYFFDLVYDNFIANMPTNYMWPSLQLNARLLYAKNHKAHMASLSQDSANPLEVTGLTARMQALSKVLLSLNLSPDVCLSFYVKHANNRPFEDV